MSLYGPFWLKKECQTEIILAKLIEDDVLLLFIPMQYLNYYRLFSLFSS